MTEVVYGQADPLRVHASALVLLVQQHRNESGLPVVAMDDVRPLAGLEHELHGRLAEEREAGRVVLIAVVAAALEEAVGRVRLDEIALPAVHETEPHRAVHRPAVPGKDDLHGVPADLQLATQPEHDLAQATSLRDRSTFRSDHCHVHANHTIPRRPASTRTGVTVQRSALCGEEPG